MSTEQMKDNVSKTDIWKCLLVQDSKVIDEFNILDQDYSNDLFEQS